MRRKFLSTAYNSVSELFSSEIISRTPALKLNWSSFRLKIMGFPYKIAYDAGFYPTSESYYGVLTSSNGRKQIGLEIETKLEEV